jgi:hypothetical protein
MTFYQCSGSGSPTLLLRVLLPAGAVSDSNHVICRPSNDSIDAGGGRDQRFREPGVRDRVQPGLHRQLPDVPHPPRVQDSLVAEGTLPTECRPSPPLPLRVATAGNNHLNKEITPLLPTGIGERCSQTISNLGQAALLRRCADLPPPFLYV